MSNFIQPITDGNDNLLIMLGRVAVAVTVGAVLSHFGIPHWPGNIKL